MVACDRKSCETSAQPFGGTALEAKTKRVLTEWSSGPIAGLVPLGVFLLIHSVEKAEALPKGHPRVYGFERDLIGHLLVFAIVTSSVSTFTAFQRLFGKQASVQLGDASALLIVWNTLILVFSTTLYSLVLSRSAGTGIGIWFYSGILVIFTIVVSIAIEFAIANERLRETGESPPA